MEPDSEKLIALLQKDHPDLSGWTLVCASDRAVDPVQQRIHDRLGGILPRVEGIRAYLDRKIGEQKSWYPVPADEILLYWIQFIAESFPEEKIPVRRAANRLPLVARLAEYQVGKETIAGSERFTSEQWEQLEQYLETAKGFRRWLSRKKLFWAELEAVRFDEILPDDREIFIGLPELTPPRERFYRKIKKERLFVDPPLFGPEPAAAGPLPFDSAKNLVLSFGGAVRVAQNLNIEFLRLAGLHAAADWVTLEVSRFLDERSEEDRLMICILDESLTPMLWNRSLRGFGNAVNLAVWLPFSATSAGRRLLAEIHRTAQTGRTPDFRKFAAGCAAELSANRQLYIREECEALEAAVSLSTLLDDWKGRLGRHLAEAAAILIEKKKFRVTGSRFAPVQVVGFGHASGETFSRGLIFPVDSGIMPAPPFEGPFINPVHVPRMRKNVFEYQDLLFRQILADCAKVAVAAVDDAIRERTPSYYMSLLSEEFGKPAIKVAFRGPKPDLRDKIPCSVPVDETLRTRLKDFTFSYSSLSKILACPFLFYHQYILGVSPPTFMDDDEKINLQMGIFVHRFLQQLSTVRKDRLDDWGPIFDELWESGENEALKSLEGVEIYRLNAEIILREIDEEERAAGRKILFADNAISCEEKFSGKIAGRYGITGRPDRLALLEGRAEVIDFKYSKKRSGFSLPARETVLERFRDKNLLHPAAQLILYSHFIPDVKGARFYFLKETAKERMMELPKEVLDEAGGLVSAIANRLDEIVRGDHLAPNHESQECEFCRLQSLCGKEGYYRTAGGRR
ncbi:MAG TPA: PD-(D/E)XK nuclease family protein [Smithellaceae bacterium]|nr:PD-(D/E)XK nuclease family protein [Smithellaceae bacterium]